MAKNSDGLTRHLGLFHYHKVTASAHGTNSLPPTASTEAGWWSVLVRRGKREVPTVSTKASSLKQGRCWSP